MPLVVFFECNWHQDFPNHGVFFLLPILENGTPTEVGLVGEWSVSCKAAGSLADSL